MLEISREQLFKDIWQLPQKLVAQKYGITTAGLAKISKKMEVPRPWRGYWSSVRRNPGIRPPVLSPLSPSGVSSVRVSDNVFRLNLADDSSTRIQIPNQLTNPHPMIVQLECSLVPRFCGFVTSPEGFLCKSIDIGAGSRKRVFLLLDVLLKEAEKLGFNVCWHAYMGLRLHMKGEYLRLSVVEGRTPIQSYQFAREKARKLKYSVPSGEDFLGFLDFPTGELCLRVEQSNYTITRRWVDKRNVKLEDIFHLPIAFLKKAKTQIEIGKVSTERSTNSSQPKCGPEASRLERSDKPVGEASD